MALPPPTTIDATLALLRNSGYVADRPLATVLFLALRLGRPLFLEGEAGVGKTEIAKVLSAALGRRLIRLQCYEGLDVASAVYEWNYAGQMMAIRLAEAGGEVDRGRLESDLFSDRYLVRRPLLQALEPDPAGPPVLLIDELDRTDEAFEAFLLEVLSDFQVTIPELGTVKAEHPPIVIITSNRTREIHDALKRRCLYHWLDYPDAPRELAILRSRVPQAPAKLSKEIVGFVQAIRREDLFKSPGVAETLDWASALVELDAVALDPALVSDTLGVLLEVSGRHSEDAGLEGQGRARRSARRREDRMTNERKAIEEVVQTYLDGLYEGDTQKLARVFHETSALTGDIDGKLTIVPRDQWLAAVKNRPSPKSQNLSRHDEILEIDIAGPTTAFVKVKCAIPPRFFTDYLSLLKLDGRWQVAQKIYAAETREAARVAAE